MLGDTQGAARDLLESEWRDAARNWIDGAIALADLLERIERPEKAGTARAETEELWGDLRRIMSGMLAVVDDLASSVGPIESEQ